MFYLPLLFLNLALLEPASDVPATHELDREAVMRVIRKTVAERPGFVGASLEIVDVSHFPVPDGEMEFDWKGLTTPANGQTTARWRGSVRHDADHIYSIWATVKITVPCKRVIATTTIKQEIPITEADVQEEAYDGFPSETCNTGIAAVLGKVATRTISANAPILRSVLAAPASVLKGDQAVAVYRDSAVWLSLPVIAERNGRIGETIPVRNPSSQKILFGRVTGDGKVLIDGEKK